MKHLPYNTGSIQLEFVMNRLPHIAVFFVAFLPSKVLTHIGDATIIRGRATGSKAKEALGPLTALFDPDDMGFTIYKGHLITGTIEPSLRLAVGAVAGKGLPAAMALITASAMRPKDSLYSCTPCSPPQDSSTLVGHELLGQRRYQPSKPRASA